MSPNYDIFSYRSRTIGFDFSFNPFENIVQKGDEQRARKNANTLKDHWQYCLWFIIFPIESIYLFDDLPFLIWHSWFRNDTNIKCFVTIDWNNSKLDVIDCYKKQ